jgi:hypothetical protein
MVYLAGGEIDETSVSLRFSGDTLDPDEITKLLDCQPTNITEKATFCRTGATAESPKLECGA